MSVAIIGGGLTGCLIALELAEAGKKVLLFEKEPKPLSRASLANEGKIHLGFVYAADKSFLTAKRMIDDALVFRPILERWISSDDFERCLYDSFDYVVPETSMLSVNAIRDHFKSVAKYINARSETLGLRYLGQKSAHVFQESGTKQSNLQTVFNTVERGVWPALIAKAISESLYSHPSIEIKVGASVSDVRAHGEKWCVGIEGGDETHGPFDTVINCAWAERRHIDASSGFTDHETWFYRYKFGVILENAAAAFVEKPPKNTTAMLGLYGDSVYHAPEDVLYCSWHPAGMCFSTSTPNDLKRPDAGDIHSMVKETWRGYSSIDPAYRSILNTANLNDARLIGDFIAARARTDIDDPNSHLHKRSDIGPKELAPGYWTVETGKYTSTARCADQCAQAILSRDQV